MVLTHRKKRELKEEPIFYKEDNPERLHMSKDEVLLENAMNRRKKKKMEHQEEKIDRESKIEVLSEELDMLNAKIKDTKDRAVKVKLQRSRDKINSMLNDLESEEKEDDECPKDVDNLDNKDAGIKKSDVEIEIDKLLKEYDSCSGKGAQSRKEEIAEKIRVLEEQLPVNKKF